MILSGWASQLLGAAAEDRARRQRVQEFEPDESLFVLVDYQRSPLRTWTATATPDGLEPVGRHAANAPDAFAAAMNLIETFREQVRMLVSTMHTFDGDPVAGASSSPRAACCTTRSPSPTAPASTAADRCRRPTCTAG
jgi:hypothetical protein